VNFFELKKKTQNCGSFDFFENFQAHKIKEVITKEIKINEPLNISTIVYVYVP